PGAVEREARGHGDLEEGGDATVRGAGSPRRERLQTGGQGRPQPGLAVAVPEAVDREVRRWREVPELAPRPHELLRIEADLELPEREGVRPGGEAHLLAVFAHEARGERAVVEVRRQPRAGVEKIGWRSRALREEYGVGVDGGRQVMGLRARPLAMEERQLGQREQPILLSRWPEAGVQLGEGAGRVLGKALAQVEPLEDLNGVEARLPPRE